ncbi:MAG: DUF4138 domain-containing protein [bacterium]
MKHAPLFLATMLVFVTYHAQAQKTSTVRVKPGYATVIVCPAQPELVTVGSPEKFSVQSTGTYVLVKPLVNAGSTNLFIKSGDDSYSMVLQISDTPDLEIRLQPTVSPLPASATLPTAKTGTATNGTSHSATTSHGGMKAKDLESLSPKVRSVLSGYLREPQPYAYSVVNSGVILGVDHMAMIENRLHVLCTLINNSHIAYDVGFVRFKLVEKVKTMLFFSKRVKEEEIEPMRDFFNGHVLPNSSTRLLFVFDKMGLTDHSVIEIACNEESGRRTLSLAVPASFVK